MTTYQGLGKSGAWAKNQSQALPSRPRAKASSDKGGHDAARNTHTSHMILDEPYQHHGKARLGETDMMYLAKPFDDPSHLARGSSTGRINVSDGANRSTHHRIPAAGEPDPRHVEHYPQTLDDVDLLPSGGGTLSPSARTIRQSSTSLNSARSSGPAGPREPAHATGMPGEAGGTPLARWLAAPSTSDPYDAINPNDHSAKGVQWHCRKEPAYTERKGPTASSRASAGSRIWSNADKPLHATIETDTTSIGSSAN
ncbi:hypothetical protein LTR20_000715 [Exophiala xenobiotica]|nr:hypothetical protein LTR93_001886 [Exophiala xenobiotica]KAK5417239.1 hypothetical protein LTR06_003226 [Exophiala xenobiotica]KAK5473255.1 hypothetical protein LTR20_000715 [Exophiala xenobiotica]KAK5526960.1 hypothetical protein LTR07_000732 [Exophiala xenobiotica]